MTQTDFNQDGYLEATVGARALQTGAACLSDDVLYAEGGLPARIVDMPADTAIKGGVAITGDDDGVIAAEMDRLSVLPLLADAARWSRLRGGGCLVLIVDDGGLLPDPLNFDRIDTIHELRVYVIDDVSADRLYEDPTQRNYGQPERYRIAVQGMGAQVLVHESRLIEVPGEPMPSRLRGDRIPWRGRPAVTRAYRRVRDYVESLSLSREILRRKQQAVHAMKGLADAILADQEAAVQKRIAMVDRARGVLNGVAVDAEDQYSIVDSGVSGIADLIQEFQVAVAADSGIPVTLLFGRSPGGQNATGDADFEGYYNSVEQLRTLRMQPALERIIALICVQRTIAAKAPQNWSIEWQPLKQLSDKEAADVAKTEAEALKIKTEAIAAAAGTSGLSEDDVRAYMEQERMFGLVPADETAGTATGYAGSL